MHGTYMLRFQQHGYNIVHCTSCTQALNLQVGGTIMCMCMNLVIVYTHWMMSQYHLDWWSTEHACLQSTQQMHLSPSLQIASTSQTESTEVFQLFYCFPHWDLSKTCYISAQPSDAAEYLQIQLLHLCLLLEVSYSPMLCLLGQKNRMITQNIWSDTAATSFFDVWFSVAILEGGYYLRVHLFWWEAGV